MTAVQTRLNSMAALRILVVVAFFVRSISAESCGVDSTDPESMSCNPALSSTLFTTTSAARAREADGLSATFYSKSCPNYNTIIKQAVAESLKTDPFQAGGIARIMFHDCFVQGCDASILLKSSSGSEQEATPNLSLRQESLQLVADIKCKLEAACPNTVSCADILSVAAAEAIHQSGGPSIEVLVGRRDGENSASDSVVLSHIPSPFNNVSENLPIFMSLGLDNTDMVALSGAHTLGQAHCSSFSGRLRPTADPDLDVKFANTLTSLCPANSKNVHGLDSTPTVFDNKFFKEVLSGDVLLTSDASMELSDSTLSLVKQYAKSHIKFNAQFVSSFLKMSQLNVLTGKQGEVRETCSAKTDGSQRQ